MQPAEPTKDVDHGSGIRTLMPSHFAIKYSLDPDAKEVMNAANSGLLEKFDANKATGSSDKKYVMQPAERTMDVNYSSGIRTFMSSHFRKMTLNPDAKELLAKLLNAANRGLVEKFDANLATGSSADKNYLRGSRKAIESYFEGELRAYAAAEAERQLTLLERGAMKLKMAGDGKPTQQSLNENPCIKSIFDGISHSDPKRKSAELGHVSALLRAIAAEIAEGNQLTPQEVKDLCGNGLGELKPSKGKSESTETTPHKKKESGASKTAQESAVAMASLSHNGTLESFELIQDPELPTTEESDPNNLQRDLVSATFDLNADEIQRRLVELAEDNIALRESLKHSSDVMRNDLSAIASWHNNITTTIARQEISLQEANDRIRELTEGKERLLEKIRRMEEEAAASLKVINVENTVPSDEEEYEIVQKKSKAAECVKVKDAELQIVKLNQEVEAQNLKIESLKEMFEESEKENYLLKSRLSNEDELNAKLCDLQKQVSSFEQLKCGLEAKVKELETQLQSGLPTPSMDVMADAVLLGQMNDLRERHAKEVEELKARIVRLEEQLAWEERDAETERIKHKEAKKLLIVLQSNYDRQTKILQLQSRNQKEKDMTSDSEREMEARKNLEQVDTLTAKLFDLEQKLEEREARVLALNNELGLQKEDADSVPVLKAQVEVLRIDLDNAVLAKEAAQEEAVQLNQQLKDMQAAATFCSNCGAGGCVGDSPSRGAKGGSRRRAHSNRQPESHVSRGAEADLFVCPVCQFGFTELQALENHVNNCIDKSEH